VQDATTAGATPFLAPVGAREMRTQLRNIGMIRPGHQGDDPEPWRNEAPEPPCQKPVGRACFSLLGVESAAVKRPSSTATLPISSA
jgi:hypothetical protein